MTDESEFGKGLTYCLGLFLKHDERISSYFPKEQREAMAMGWFYGAEDHLREIQTDGLPEDIKNKVIELRKYCSDRRFGTLASANDYIEDIKTAINMAEDILFMIDERIIGVEVARATWR